MTHNERLTPRAFTAAVIILTLAAALLRVLWLATTPANGDELYTVADAFDYMRRGHSGLLQWHHPKLRNVLVYLSMTVLGRDAFGMRFASVLLGTLTVPLVALVARALTGSRYCALLAAFFMAIDPIQILFSRQSVQEVYMPCFLLAGYYLALLYLEKRKPSLLFYAGIFFGLGLASKWMGLAIQLFLLVVLLVYRFLKEGEPGIRARAEEFLLYFSSLVVLPATIYLLSYAPWFIYRGYDIGEWLVLQKVAFLENLTHKGANAFIHVQDHTAALWFVRPTGYADFMMNGNTPIIVLALSNPFVWLLTLPATAYFLCKIKELDWRRIFLFAVLWCSYLPLAVSHRVTAANSALGILPFALMLSASFLVDLAKGRPHVKRYLPLYLGIVILVTVPLYLMTVGKEFGTWFQPIFDLYRPLNER